ncbi:MAG: protein translocase subunit SecD [Gemmatimonadetes bacterium]|nr:protein translocase subunit SecD [Gemmatimonadota bacterium]
MSNLKHRIGLIVGLIALSAWALIPRDTIERVKRADGSIGFDTVKRVPLKLGLDLQGGMHLTLELDESQGTIADKSDAIDKALKVVRTRVDEFGVAEPVVQREGVDKIIVELPGIDDPERATRVVQKSAYLKFQITDMTQALERVSARLDGIVRDRKLGVVAPDVRGDSARSPGLAALLTDTSKKSADTAATVTNGPFNRLIQPSGNPGIYYVATTDQAELDVYLQHPDIQAALPPGKEIRWGVDTVSANGRIMRALYVLDARPIITGEYLTDARPNQVPIDGTVVEFQFNNEGGRRFRAETGKHIQHFMAIVLDERVMSAPIIQSAIGTRGQITMAGGSLAAATDLALVLRAGALPVPLRVAEARNIGASLGEDSIRKGMAAGALAVVLVVGVMLGYYRFAGLLAVCGLTLYMIFTLATLSAFGAVLTLPGIAGFVLSIGIAVDANVLIFERIREELVHGKTVRTSIEEGFRHAMPAIVDTSVSTALTAAVLYQYGTGPVRGFAVTLLAGITASLFTAVFVGRTFFLIWLNRNRTAEALSI